LVLTPDQLPASHRTLAEVFAGEPETTLGGAFAGLFLYGAACFRPAIAADFDYHVLLSRPLNDTDRTELDRLHGRLEREVPLGDDMDGYYVTVEAAASRNALLTSGIPAFSTGPGPCTGPTSTAGAMP
jgi:hypothetical protein